MRVNLITRCSKESQAVLGTIPLSLTIRPACGLPGDYQYPTDSVALLRMLHKQTDLPASILQRFEETLYASSTARLLGVELSDRVLTEIGYFVD
jgi:hypothetical protein